MRNIACMLVAFLLSILSACAGESAPCMGVNVLVATRDSKIPACAEINKEEVYLVFAQLAKVIPGNDIGEIRRILQEKEFGRPSDFMKGQILSMFDSKRETVAIAPDKPTLILFNEMFFGRDRGFREGESELRSKLL